MAVKNTAAADVVLDESYRGKASKRRRKKKNAIFYLFLFVLLITVVSITSLTIFFNIKEIKVSGDVIYSPDEIRQALSIPVGTNMFRIDKFKAVERLTRILPYIENAEIKRRLPEVLEVIVTPAKPAVFVETAGGYVILSDKAKVLKNVTEKPQLPKLLGSGIVKNTEGEPAVFGSEVLGELYMSVYSVLRSQNIIDKMTEINITKRINLTFEYEGRIYVKLGNSDILERKIKFFNYILSEHPENNKAVIDVSGTADKRATFDDLTDEEYAALKSNT